MIIKVRKYFILISKSNTPTCRPNTHCELFRQCLYVQMYICIYHCARPFKNHPPPPVFHPRTRPHIVYLHKCVRFRFSNFPTNFLAGQIAKRGKTGQCGLYSAAIRCGFTYISTKNCLLLLLFRFPIREHVSATCKSNAH